MKLISYEFGQSLQMIRMDEVRPLHGIYMPDVILKIGNRYRFVTRPMEINAETANAITFEIGIIQIGDQQTAIASLGVYNDGILVVCRDTNDADRVTDDFISWATEEFSLRQIQTHIPRKHTSHVVVDFDVSLDAIVSSFTAIASIFELALKADQGVQIAPRVQRLVLASDPLDGLPLAQTSFTLEPRSGTPFSSQRFFSAAPMSSEAHLNMLTAIEDVLRKSA